MTLFILLVTNALPLLALIAIGFVAGRKLNIDTMTLANIVIFIITPIVNFGAMAKLVFDPSYLLLPVVIYIFSAVVSLGAFFVSNRYIKDGRSNIIGMSAGSGNTGYFGVPIILSLFGHDVLGIYLLMNLGVALAEVTVGYYIAARNHSSVRESFQKVLRLPLVYAVLGGLMVNFSGLELPAVFYTYWDKFVGSWVIFGMMIMGVTLARIPSFSVNWPLLGALLAAKFIVWPVCMFGFILLDQSILGVFSAQVHTMMMVLSLVPMAVNTVVFAIKLDLKAGDAAIAVLVSTLIAIFYLPFILMLTGLAG